MTIKKFILSYGLYIAWLQSLAAMAGSLFFSEVEKFTPCVLCWYQRVFMYPLIIILWVGISKKDKSVVDYALPLSFIGTLIAIYHNLLYNKILPEAVAPCAIGASCLTKYIEWFGFITIPFLSLAAFLIIDIMLLYYKKYSNK